MAYKIYQTDNVVHLVDTITLKDYEGLASLVLPRKDLENSETLFFTGLNGFDVNIGIPFADFQDRNGDAFPDFETLYALVTNFNTPQVGGVKEIILKIDSANNVTKLKDTSGLNPTFTITNTSIGKDDLISSVNLGSFNVWLLNERTYTSETIAVESRYQFDCYQDDGLTIKIIKRVLDFTIDFVGLSFVNQYILGDPIPYNDSIIQIILNE